MTKSPWMSWVLSCLCLVLVAILTIEWLLACDLWWQLKTGELIWTQHRIPHADVFSHTAAGQPWYVQEWLAELILFGLCRGISPEALVAYKVVAVTLTFGLVLWTCRRRSGSAAVAAGVTTLAAYAARPFFDIRPQLFTYMLFAVSVLVLDEWRRGSSMRRIWVLPGVALLWVNLHGGFLLLFVLLGVEVAAAAWHRDRRLGVLLVVALLCGLAGLGNPNGLEAYRYPFVVLRHQYAMDHVVEWASPDFHRSWMRPFLGLLLMATLSLGMGRRIALRDWLLLAGLAHSALYSKRHMPVMAVACAPIIAEQLRVIGTAIQAWMSERRWAWARWSRAAAACLGLLLGARIAVEARQLPPDAWFEYCTTLPMFPVAACDYLVAHPEGSRLFNDYNWGGYCDWRLWPRYRVFIDGRTEVFFRTGYAEYEQIQALKPGWEAQLNRSRVDTVLIPCFTLLSQALAARPEWRLVYQDDLACVFRRRAERPTAGSSQAQKSDQET